MGKLRHALAWILAGIATPAMAGPVESYEAALARGDLREAGRAADALVAARLPADGKPRPDRFLNGVVGRLLLRGGQIVPARAYLEQALSPEYSPGHGGRSRARPRRGAGPRRRLDRGARQLPRAARRRPEHRPAPPPRLRHRTPAAAGGARPSDSPAHPSARRLARPRRSLGGRAAARLRAPADRQCRRRTGGRRSRVDRRRVGAGRRWRAVDGRAGPRRARRGRSR